MTYRYILDLTCLGTIVRTCGIGRYATFLSQALNDLEDQLASDELILALLQFRGSSGEPVFTSLRNIEEAINVRPTVSAPVLDYNHYKQIHRRQAEAAMRRLSPTVAHFMEGSTCAPSPAYQTVVTCHDLIPFLLPNDYFPFPKGLRARYQRAVERRRYAKVDRIIAISDVVAHSLQSELLVPAQKIAVALNAVDHDAFHAHASAEAFENLRNAYGLPKRYCLYIGGSDPRKRVGLLLQAYQRVYRETGIPLAFVGHDSPKITDRYLTACAGEPASVLAVHEVRDEEVPTLYQHAQLHVLPSVYEGFGLTVLEAMACGCPVVTTTGGALPEVGGDAVCYVPSDSQHKLEENLLRLLHDPNERRHLAERGVARAARFRWEDTAHRTLNAYRQTARHPLARSPEDVTTTLTIP